MDEQEKIKQEKTAAFILQNLQSERILAEIREKNTLENKLEYITKLLTISEAKVKLLENEFYAFQKNLEDIISHCSDEIKKLQELYVKYDSLI